jgi:microsomal epoxide hydrolase
MRLLTAMIAFVASLAGGATCGAHAADRSFVTSDGVRLHYTDTGSGQALVFVPGWTMPGWIFAPQVAAFAPHYRVVVLDPRGQGQSDAPPSGYQSDRRGQDIAELLAGLGGERPVVVAWSLGVLDTLAFVHDHGDGAIAGLVLIDNSVGENPPPPAEPHRPAKRQTHDVFMAGFVRSMFARPQPPEYLRRLTEASLRTPEFAANAMLSIKVPRSYWKEAVYSTAKPVLYVVRPAFLGQARNLAANHPAAETVVMDHIGHALFVDDPARFNALLQSFLTRRIWK